jgi:deoxyribonuclease-4
MVVHLAMYLRGMIVGAHVPSEDPLGHAENIGAECLQLFVGPPQSWKKPPPLPDAAELKGSSLPVFVHAPYLINVASPNNRVRIPSRKILAQTIERSEEIDAAGIIVHAGHAEDGIPRGFMRWRKVFEELETDIPILIENTAGGENAMGRKVDVLAELWENLSDFDVGFCFDTCHAHAAGEDLVDVVKRVRKATGRIDLVHANSSKDPAGSGRDRHCNFADGELDREVLLAMVEASGSPAVICETPWEGIADDVGWLKERLA